MGYIEMVSLCIETGRLNLKDKDLLYQDMEAEKLSLKDSNNDSLPRVFLPSPLLLGYPFTSRCPSFP